jgi:hypothetical protein
VWFSWFLLGTIQAIAWSAFFRIKRARAGYSPGKWWRVLGPEEELWCETSSEKEARAIMRPGDILERHYVKHDAQWRRVK